MQIDPRQHPEWLQLEAAEFEARRRRQSMITGFVVSLALGLFGIGIAILVNVSLG